MSPTDGVSPTTRQSRFSAPTGNFLHRDGFPGRFRRVQIAPKYRHAAGYSPDISGIEPASSGYADFLERDRESLSASWPARVGHPRKPIAVSRPTDCATGATR